MTTEMIMAKVLSLIPAMCTVVVIKQSCKQSNHLILWGVGDTPSRLLFYFIFIFIFLVGKDGGLSAVQETTGQRQVRRRPNVRVLSYEHSRRHPPHVYDPQTRTPDKGTYHG